MKTTYVPEWKKYEKDLYSDDAKKSLQAADAFDETRKQEIQFSEKAKKWESDRKKEWQKNKPDYIKKKRKEEKLYEEKILRELREGGYLMGGLKPSPGLMLVKKTDQKEGVSLGGIVIPDSVEYESNLANVVRVGEGMINAFGKIDPPCKEGDIVLFRKGAGLNVKINNEAHLIIRFDEVFGVVEK